VGLSNCTPWYQRYTGVNKLPNESSPRLWQFKLKWCVMVDFHANCQKIKLSTSNSTKLVSRNSTNLLGIDFIEVILTELDTGTPVGRVELVWYVPTKRSKLPSFLQSPHCTSKWHLSQYALSHAVYSAWPRLHHTYIHTYIHTYTRLTALFPGTTRVSRYQKGKNQSGFYWSKRQWVAVASAGPYASLHLAPDR